MHFPSPGRFAPVPLPSRGEGCYLPNMLRLLVAFLLLLTPAQARAAVELAFYSHEFDARRGRYPHAFITLKGAPDAGGRAVNVNYGFTARSVSPAILTRPVKGMLHSADAPYIGRSQRQYAMRLTDAQYGAVRARIAAWRREGDTYDLSRRNCVHFVREIARAVGLAVREDAAFIKQPRAFLQDMARRNARQ